MSMPVPPLALVLGCSPTSSYWPNQPTALPLSPTSPSLTCHPPIAAVSQSPVIKSMKIKGCSHFLSHPVFSREGVGGHLGSLPQKCFCSFYFFVWFIPEKTCKIQICASRLISCCWSWAPKHCINDASNDVREAPPKLVSPLFGHCP